MSSRERRIDSLMRLYEHGEMSRAEVAEQIQQADEHADDRRRKREGIA